IRRTSKTLGLRTESSIRFERGTDIEGLIVALDRAAYLIQALAGGEISERIDVYPYPRQQAEVSLREDFLRAHLGVDISLSQAEKILQNLGFEIKEHSEGKVIVQVPSYRSDVSIEPDLVEEVARIWGYHRVPSLLPETSIGAKGLTPEKRKLNRIRQLLMDEGYHEAINYSFIDPVHLKKLSLKEDDPRQRVIKLENPLSTEQSIMRPFLLPCLIDSLIRNLTRGVREVRLFEQGKVFLKSDNEDSPAREEIHLGGILYIKKGHKLWQNTQDVFYQIKGVLEKVLQFLGQEDYEFRVSEEPFLHPGKGASVSLNNEVIGFVGVLGPETKRAYDIEHYREDIGVFEIDLTGLLSMPEKQKRFKHIPRFPYIQRDISLLLPRDRTVQDAIGYIKSIPEETIEDAWVFDLYEGRAVPEGFRSVGISVIYRSKDRTLTEEEAEALHQKVLKGLLEHTGAKLR
ncbi:MAG: phenylalanine--tRNA ligase subunit beta, partial [Nitrospirae bacterium]